MIFTLIAIICVAITGTAGADSTTGARNGGQSGMPVGFTDSTYGYSCSKGVDDYMNAKVMPELERCLLERWATGPDFLLVCCRYYEMNGIVMEQIRNNCTKIEDKNFEEGINLVCHSDLNGQQLDDKFCNGLKGRREMSPYCKKLIDELMPTADAHSDRPSTPVSVLLAAIVVSIAGDVYSF